MTHYSKAVDFMYACDVKYFYRTAVYSSHNGITKDTLRFGVVSEYNRAHIFKWRDDTPHQFKSLSLFAPTHDFLREHVYVVALHIKTRALQGILLESADGQRHTYMGFISPRFSFRDKYANTEAFYDALFQT